MLARTNAGIARYSQNVLRELARQDQHNRYYIFVRPDGLQEHVPLGPNFEYILADYPIFSQAEQLAFWRKLNATKLDLVHFLNFNHPILYRKPFIATIHDLILSFYPSGRAGRSRVRKLAYNSVMRHAALKSAATIVPSQATADDLITHIGARAEKISVIHEAADDFRASLRDVDMRRTLFELGINKPYFLFVSQWRPHKGIETLLEAFEHVYQKNHNIQLVLTGSGKQDFAQILEAVRLAKLHLPIITTGFIDDQVLRLLYEKARALIFPSVYEGFGLPPLEAAAFGLPTIAAHSSSVPEIMADSALYFEPNNPVDLAKKMRLMLTKSGLRSTMSKKAKSRAKQFAWKNTVAQTMDLYQSVLNNK